jgi:hypothetical protein
MELTDMIASTNFGKDFKTRKQLIFHSMRSFGFGGKMLEETVWDETKFLVEEFVKHADGTTPTCVHYDLMHLAVSNVICSVIFGKRFDYRDEAFGAAIHGIRWILSTPGAAPGSIQSLASKNRKAQAQHTVTILDFIDKQVQSHKEDFDSNSPRDFIDLCLEKAANEGAGHGANNLGVRRINGLLGVMYL